ncbi:MAG: N-6 DNA methylase [Phycisphaerae bacterium]|nr:N-6 DNA methylase [Phycisphaerae bacterium]
MKVQSLDELIARKAVEFAEQMKAAAAMADNEEEIRIEAEKQLAFIQKDAGIKLTGKHEFTVARGRIDSVYQRVIIEYKNPSSPSRRIGPKTSSPGTKKVVAQIKKRFFDLRQEHGQIFNSLFGVGFDGNRFVFVRYRDDKWQVQEPIGVNRYSSERFLWALFNLGQKGKPFSPEYLARDFGSDSKLAQEGIHTLYDAIATAKHPKAQTFFNQWKILFGEVCGYDVDNPSKKIRKLADFYGIPLKGLKPAELLFAVHSYYAIFMKLLASEIVAFFHKLPTPLAKMMQASTSNKLKREMEELEAGSIFRHLNITNFLEGDLFSWYVPVWSDAVEKMVRDMVAKLDDYNPGTLSEDPAGSRDLLKKLYQQLFPKSVRHDLGEYYTPDWLAEHVLNKLGYVGDPDKRILDPACGSGTFLVKAINRIRDWYDKNREKCAFGEDDLCRKILANVIGFDLNPLAVMAARTNYLIAIRDLIGRVDLVEIPVYLCDSVLTPAEYGDKNQSMMFGKPMVLKTGAKPTPFFIPRETTVNQGIIARYTDILVETAPLASRCTSEDFLQRLRDDGLPVDEVDDHLRLFRDLRQLDKANKNGVWARIIKNAFAPLFVGTVDYIAGNPPWVNWNNLPSDYRADSKPLWKNFALWPRYVLGASADLSKLFFYASISAYLRPGGKIGFVITQSLFKTSGGDLFRRFMLPEDEPIRCDHVDDMVALQPFEGATNRTSVLVADRGTRTSYPVPYTVWTPKGRRSTMSDLSLAEVHGITIQENHNAVPILDEDSTSPWLTNRPEVVRVLKKAAGKNAYDSYIGIHTYGGNGVYFVDKQKEMGTHWLVQNDVKGIKSDIESETFSIERSLLARLLRGRDVQADEVNCNQFIIFPYSDEGEIIVEDKLRTKYKKGYAFLRKHMDFLAGRSEYVRRGRKGPWYQLFCIYRATFAPHKVIWREQSATLTPAVLIGDKERPIVPDHKLMFIPCWNESEAYYLFSLLNSTIIQQIVVSVSIETQHSTRVMGALRLPAFKRTDPVHKKVALLGKRIVTEGRCRLIQKLDDTVSPIWNLSRNDCGILREIGAQRVSERLVSKD